MVEALKAAEALTAAEGSASRVRVFAREQVAAHRVWVPSDQPELDAVVRRRVSDTDHPAADHEELLAASRPITAGGECGLLSGAAVSRACEAAGHARVSCGLPSAATATGPGRRPAP